MKLFLLVALVCAGLLLLPNVRNKIFGRMSAALQTGGQSSCSDGWYITGYYVPREDELPGPTEEIQSCGSSFASGILR